jgi:hypothetical protein
MTLLSFLSIHDPGLMEFMVMSLEFPPPREDASGDVPPDFRTLATFITSGYVLNLFLLDPQTHLLAAYIWLPESKSMGLYVLFDWEHSDYAFINTGIECVSVAATLVVRPTNWRYRTPWPRLQIGLASSRAIDWSCMLKTPMV